MSSLASRPFLQKDSNEYSNHNENDVDSDTRNAKGTRAIRVRSSWFESGHRDRRNRGSFVKAGPSRALNEMMNFRQTVLKTTRIVACFGRRFIDVDGTSR